MNIVDIVAPEFVKCSEQMHTKKTEGVARTTYELAILTKDNQSVPIETSSRLIYEDGKPVAIQGVARDVSRQPRSRVSFHPP